MSCVLSTKDIRLMRSDICVQFTLSIVHTVDMNFKILSQGAFIVYCNAAAVPMYRLPIYRRSTQRTAAKLKLI